MIISDFCLSLVLIKLFTSIEIQMKHQLFTELKSFKTLKDTALIFFTT